jgi:hypothetical protein
MKSKKLYNPAVLNLFMNADIILRDNENNPILLADVRCKTMHSEVSQQILESLVKAKGDIPFVMLVNLENIEIYQWNKKSSIANFKTADILNFYDPDFRKKRILPNYLIALVDAWLSDLAYHWKSSEPPAMLEIQNIGLLEKVRNGSTEKND